MRSAEAADGPAAISRPPRPSAAAGVLTDLAITPIAETIRCLWRERRSGDLFVRSRKTTKMVFFDGGRIVFAASNVKKERLGEVLVALGTISRADFQRASLLVTQQKVRFGDALVTAGVMRTEDVGPAVAAWMERMVVSLFDLRVGSASFEDRPCVIPPAYRVELAVDRVLRAGIRTMSRHELILGALGHLDRRVVFAGPAAFAPDPEDQAMLAMAKAPVTVRRLAWTSEGLLPDRVRAIYALVAAGALVEPAKKLPPPKAAGASSVAPAPPPAVDAAVRLEICEQLARSESLDFQAWLGLSPSASKDEVIRRLEGQKQAYEALRPRLKGDTELHTDLELLINRVRTAVRVAQRASAPAPLAVPMPAPAAGPASAEAASVSMEIEHLTMEANIRMSVGDFVDAARTYARLVQLEPEVADHHARLGLAMARSPRTARQAEAELQEALRLDPSNAEIHFQLGLYYKGMNVRSRSIAAFRSAVELNPRHKKARLELEDRAPQASAMVALKKLLG